MNEFKEHARTEFKESLDRLERLLRLQSGYRELAGLKSSDDIPTTVIKAIRPLSPTGNIIVFDRNIILRAEDPDGITKISLSKRWKPSIISYGSSDDLNAPVFAGTGWYLCGTLGRSRLALYVDGFSTCPDMELRDDFHSFTAFAGVSILALRMAEEDRTAAMTDALTGIPNRRALEIQLRKMISELDRFAYAIIDLDFFKQINDTKGHKAGDEVLQRVGKCLMEQVRASDFCARLAGDEFVVLLGAGDEKAAGARVKTWFANAGIAASVGMAVYPDEGKSPQELYSAADKKLYIAKKSRGTS